MDIHLSAELENLVQDKIKSGSPGLLHRHNPQMHIQRFVVFDAESHSPRLQFVNGFHLVQEANMRGVHNRISRKALGDAGLVETL